MVSLAEAMGRLILQDPSFICVFNERDGTTVENCKDSALDYRESLKRKKEGIWSHSLKYPNLQVYFCFVTPFTEYKMGDDARRLNNVLLTCYWDLPFELMKNTNLPPMN